MLKNLRNVLAATTLAAALVIPAASFAQPGGQDRDDKKEERSEGKEQHPVIRQSIRQLENVKRELTTKAASDFGGHKVAAIKSIDEAIEHLNLALRYDKK